MEEEAAGGSLYGPWLRADIDRYFVLRWQGRGRNREQRQEENFHSEGSVEDHERSEKEVVGGDASVGDNSVG